MKLRPGYASILLAFLSVVAARAFRTLDVTWRVDGVPLGPVVVKLLVLLAVIFGTYGAYWLVYHLVTRNATDKRRVHTVRNLLRLAFFVVGVAGLLGVTTDQWVGVLVSLGVVGVAVSFALQQPLLSVMGWMYIMVKQPYRVGDRIAIDGAKGEVVEVDFLVTTLWEIGGELVSSNQPSGRTITVPNSVVLSSSVVNFTPEHFPWVWNEISIQVAYETDMAFAVETMETVAVDFLGEEMATHVGTYRDLLSETAVSLEVRERPSVNVKIEQSWVELRLRYLTHPRRGQAVKNELYDRVLAEFDADPDRVKFPVGRNR